MDRKLIYLIVLLFLSHALSAQTADTTKVVYRDAQVNSNAPLYIVDGEIIKSINNVKPDSILEISILKDQNATSIYGQEAINGVVIITNRRFAITHYQSNFSKLSKKYKNYIRLNNCDDSGLLYVINGVPLDGKSDDIIRKLYDLNKYNIKSVNIIEKGINEESTIQKPLVIITTK
ncbi:TonB-dependent receptor plug domain-containing protein [Mucilaginibacter sp. X5P1]|uniref:TonB-dependent receptor plug domain-containing protein n=1 Tax=Mucilaginibacter sp. X5P1 TaxID=2723088 RepID=UPI00161B4AE1|nr:TonB-dependent receptor plug domain-containing protein [Mucilaginibacter sp. X5P1]MBB6141597.1 TonB-dependent SusC/RagA subfamily outer membrane receptor [Mucilaginibacter sp. X5P1]